MTQEEAIDAINDRKALYEKHRLYAACDIQVCQRCLSTARLAYYEIWCCPRCGTLKHFFEEHAKGERLEVPSAAPGGYFPVADKTMTGYYVDNPAGGYRTPARVWVVPAR